MERCGLARSVCWLLSPRWCFVNFPPPKSFVCAAEGGVAAARRSASLERGGITGRENGRARVPASTSAFTARTHARQYGYCSGEDFKWTGPPFLFFSFFFASIMKCPWSLSAQDFTLSFCPLTSQPNQEFHWQWNILNLTTPRKTLWRRAFYFGWPNCTLPVAAPCAVSHSLLKQLHFYIQIIHHRLDLFPPFFTFHTFGVLCGDLRWGGRKKSASLFFFTSYCWNTLSLWWMGEAAVIDRAALFTARLKRITQEDGVKWWLSMTFNNWLKKDKF